MCWIARFSPVFRRPPPPFPTLLWCFHDGDDRRDDGDDRRDDGDGVASALVSGAAPLLPLQSAAAIASVWSRRG